MFTYPGKKSFEEHRKPKIKEPDSEEIIERRKWYEDMQKPIFDTFYQHQQLRSKHYEELDEDKNIDDKNDKRKYSKRQIAILSQSFQLHLPSIALSVGCYHEQSPSKVIIPLNACLSPKVFLFYFPGLGCNHVELKAWSQTLLPKNTQVFGICYPGRAHRFNEPMDETYTTTIKDCLKDLLRLQLIEKQSQIHPQESIKIVFLGHSIGALYMYEIARWLFAQEYHIDALICLSCRSPMRQSQHNTDKENDFYHNLPTNQLLLQKNKELGLTYLPIQYSDRQELLRVIISLLRYDLWCFEHYILLPSYQLMASSQTLLVDDLHDVNQEGDINEVLDMPPSMFKISCPIYTILALNDLLVSEGDMHAWSLATTAVHEQFAISEGGSSRVLEHSETKEMIISLLDRLLDSPTEEQDERNEENEEERNERKEENEKMIQEYK